ncbi:hypothetical protein NEMIN01_1024 [Nematocida minor]|uniref:uncharacterized protein n=1 Tax=Nematocida minor TaxID=1912983 RepID=UPI00221EBA84|nr:uncharacterized protein NEMIN01_1024 [Nematocida minor]KAI5190400.1 hypothetical protein NEMIN01_1024 [Nematocida minor]
MHSRKLETSEIVKRLLKNKDPSYSHLLLSSVNAVVFKYEGEWVSMDIEGVIHLYKRDKIPSTAIHILNRKNPSDFHLLIDKSTYDIENYDKFIIIKKAVGNEMEVYGLWFYDAHACIESGFILSDQMELLKKSKELMAKCKAQKK